MQNYLRQMTYCHRHHYQAPNDRVQGLSGDILSRLIIPILPYQLYFTSVLNVF